MSICKPNLHELWLLVEVGRPHGREGDPLELVETLLLKQDVAQLLEQREFVGQRNLGVLEENNRENIQVVSKVVLTSKQRLCFSK